jgi:YkoY family integral membrane protein
LSLAFLEIVLSADNAIVLGLLVYTLPAVLRKKALYIGLGSAFVLRALALFLASFILQSHWLEALGGGYLIFLGMRHLLQTKKEQKSIVTTHSFWKTVVLIELFDLIFALDSIVAGVAFIAGSQPSNAMIHPKLWVIYVGGMIGVACMRYAADLFSHLIERFPNLETSAYLLVVWIGVKLGVMAFTPHIPGIEILFWVVFTMILLGGFWRKKLQ